MQNLFLEVLRHFRTVTGLECDVINWSVGVKTFHIERNFKVETNSASNCNSSQHIRIRSILESGNSRDRLLSMQTEGLFLV